MTTLVNRRLGCGITFDQNGATRVFGPFQPGDEIAALRIMFACTVAADAALVPVECHLFSLPDKLPQSATLAELRAAGRELTDPQDPPLLPYVKTAEIVVTESVPSLLGATYDVPLAQRITQHERYVAVHLIGDGTAYSGSIWLIPGTPLQPEQQP